jgi:hypothetical protein
MLPYKRVICDIRQSLEENNAYTCQLGDEKINIESNTSVLSFLSYFERLIYEESLKSFAVGLETKRKNAVTYVRKEEILEDKNNGMKNIELCKKYGISKSTLSRFLKKHWS